MDELDINNLIQVAAEDHTKMVVLDLELGIPVASEIRSVFKPYARPKVERVEVTPEQQATLKSLWAKRVATKRDLDDNDDHNQVMRLKNAYFSSIEDYKRAYKRIYGE